MENSTDVIELKLGNSVKGADIPEKDLIGVPWDFLLELESDDAEFYARS